MKNRTLLMMASAAALAAPMAQLAVPVAAERSAQAPVNTRLLAGGQLPQGGISSLLEAVLMGRGHSGGAAYKPTYGGRGHTVAHGRRMARKRRNVLRSKGQFRKAVR